MKQRVVIFLGVVIVGFVGLYWEGVNLHAGAEPTLNVQVMCQSDAIQLNFSGENWSNEPAAFYLNDSLLTAVPSLNNTVEAQWTISPIPETVSIARLRIAEFEKTALLSAPCLPEAAYAAYMPIMSKNSNLQFDIQNTLPPIVGKSTLLTDDLGFDEFEQNVHQWSLNLTQGETVSVTVATEPFLNGILTIQHPNGSLSGVELNGDGQMEMIQLAVDVSGAYKIYLNDIGLQSGSYMVNFFDNNSLPILQFFMLEDTNPIMGSLPPDTDSEWIVYLEEGEVVSFTVDPIETGVDLFLTLWSKDGDYAESDEDVGATEVIENFNVPHSGLYVLQVGEWDFNEASYTLTLEKQ